MESVKIEIKGKALEFRAEPNFIDRRKLEKEIEYLMGGMERKEEYQTILNKKLIEHDESYIAKYGQEQYNKTKEAYKKEQKERNEEEQKMVVAYIMQEKYLSFVDMVTEKDFIEGTAFMQIMQLGDTKFYEMQESDLKEIWKELKEKLLFFRKQKAESNKVNKP